MNRVLDEGSVNINGICRRVSIVKERPCYRCQKTGHKTNECDIKPFNQEDLMNMFTEPKR
jgi:hypothetical protein